MIFVDTGAFIARYLTRDQYHRHALVLWEKLRSSNQRCYTSNFVLDETLTLLGQRAGNSYAAQRARNIYTSEILTVIRPTQDDETEAIELLEKYSDQRVSFTDCISFILMHKNKLKVVFTFDSHFEMAGFTLWS